tara:strand:+ start:57 stop:1064 length:1008 start_codon:yes stop_codon:yes gene_type:complete
MSKTYPTLGNSAIAQPTFTPPDDSPNLLFAARVVDVNLEPSDNPLSLYQITNELGSIGAIRFESLTKSTNTNDKITVQAAIAYPMDINFKKIPTLGEVVFVIKGPSYLQSIKNDSDAFQYYYFNAVSIWNKTHLNMLPSNAAYSANTDTVDNENVSKGVPNNPDSQVEEPIPGNTFGEKTDIRNLFPVEGDVIIEGRWGNSLRFSSTAVHTSESKNNQSPWSTDGTNGSPITILRNGQGTTSNYDNWFPIYEDINKDASSIYLTDGQQIPINLTQYPFDSFNTDAKPKIDTTANIQETDVVDPNKSNVDNDSTDVVFDVVNTNGPLTEETPPNNG